jgi:hypothetical protein
MDKAELQRRLTEGNFLQKAGGLATILGENIIGGFVDDYDSPGERFGSAINYVINNPKDAGIAALNEFQRAYTNVATPRYDDEGRMTVGQDQAMDALGLASMVPTAGVTTAMASGARLTDLLEFDPNTTQMFIGIKGAAKMAENGNYTALNALNLAKRLEAEGYSDADIRLATNKFIAEGDPTLGGIDRNAAGDFRLELSDDQLELTSLLENTGMALPIDKSITGSQITEAYPNSFTLRMAPEEEGEYSYGRVLGSKSGDELETYVGQNVAKAKPIMVHEIQHGIQDVEGFPSGGNTGQANLGAYGPLRDDFEEALDFLKAQRDTNFNVYSESEELSGNALKAYRELLEANEYDVHDAIADATQTVEDLSDPATEQMLAQQYYFLKAGEAEANTTMARLGMTGPQRRAKEPIETEKEIGVPRNQQIVMGPDNNPVYVGNTAQAQTMARVTPPDIEEDILNLKLTELRREIANADRVMRIDGKSTKEIDEFKAQKRREMFELQNLPPDMDDFYAKGGAVEGVGSLSRVARDMFRGPRGIATLSRFATGGPADMSAYREALIASESSGDVGAENPSGAVGLTQAMPDTLEDFKDETGLEFTPEQYANSRELQTQFQDWYEQKTINYIMDQGLDRYIGQTIKGVPITMSSMLGMAHLGGDYGMRKFIETGGRYDPDDGYTKLSDYGRKFANMSIVGQGEVGYSPSPEEIVMSMPVEQEAEFTDPRGYSPIPQLRPQYMPTEPMPRPRLRPTDEEETPQGIPSVAGVIPGQRTNLFEQYGGIASLTNP